MPTTVSFTFRCFFELISSSLRSEQGQKKAASELSKTMWIGAPRGQPAAGHRTHHQQRTCAKLALYLIQSYSIALHILHRQQAHSHTRGKARSSSVVADRSLVVARRPFCVLPRAGAA